MYRAICLIMVEMLNAGLAFWVSTQTLSAGGGYFNQFRLVVVPRRHMQSVELETVINKTICILFPI